MGLGYIERGLVQTQQHQGGCGGPPRLAAPSADDFGRRGIRSTEPDAISVAGFCLLEGICLGLCSKWVARLQGLYMELPSAEDDALRGERGTQRESLA